MNNTKEHSIYFGNDIKPDTIFTVLCKRGKSNDDDNCTVNFNDNIEQLYVKFYDPDDTYEYQKWSPFIILGESDFCKRNGWGYNYHVYDWEHGIHCNSYNCCNHCNSYIRILDYWNTKDKETHVKYFRENIWEDMMQTFWNPTKTWCKYFMEYDE